MHSSAFFLMLFNASPPPKVSWVFLFCCYLYSAVNLHSTFTYILYIPISPYPQGASNLKVPNLH